MAAILWIWGQGMRRFSERLVWARENWWLRVWEHYSKDVEGPIEYLLVPWWGMVGNLHQTVSTLQKKFGDALYHG